MAKERWKLAAAMVSRAILIVLFAIAIISPVAPVFGSENSAMAVAMFCILLGLRFVDFSYCIKDSLVNLAVVFLLLLIAPCAAVRVNLFWAVIIHVSAFFTIIYMTSDQPEMGNAGIYTFAYIYLSGNPVSGELLLKRGVLTLIGYTLCAAILFVKHRNKNQNVRFNDVVAKFSLSNKKNQWQIQLALGVGLLLGLGNLLSLERMMWAAFACGSIVGYYSATAAQAKQRVGQRLVGTVIGALIFYCVYQAMGEELRPLLGPLGGICLAFCTDYRYKTASNCLGALFMATSLYGLQESIFLRVMHNVLGVAFGYVFLVMFQKVANTCFVSRAVENVENFSI